MAMARDGGRGVAGYVGGRAEPAFRLASFGAAGGLTGTARAVFRFDRSLMTGRLLNPARRAELWTPEGGRSYQALGAWVFPGRLAGCAAPVRIVQRDGEIGGVQTRNYIMPDADMVVVVFTNRSSDDFPIGEIWQGKGFAFDLLSAAVCGKDTA
jgi:CubicO group peptidase (beta-lactamase class C family)